MPEIKQISISLIKTLLVSVVFASAGHFLLQYPLQEGIIVMTLIQIIIFYVWNTYMEYRMRVNESIQETRRVIEYSKQGVEVQCAHCKALNFIPVRLDEENNFTCDTCNKPNAVYIDITIAQSATGINKESLSVGSYVKDKEAAIKEISDKE
jgi:hypothetical protein